MRKTIIWMAALLFVATLAAAEQPVNATRSVAADVKISIENVAGSVTIVGTEGSELTVTGTIGDDVEELEISGDAEEVSIEVVFPDSNDWQRNRQRELTAKLEIGVPRGASLEVESVSAAIDISGVSGAIEAGSVSGNVTVTGGGGSIEAESVSGAVSISGGGGSIVAESVSGPVTLNGVAGDLEAITVSGRIRIEAGGLVEDVEIETVAGGVYFQGGLGSGSLEIESHSGNVEVVLPADISASFDLESFSGRIDNGFGPPAERSDRYEPGVSVEFRTGSGAAEISVETFSGNIVLRQP